MSGGDTINGVPIAGSGDTSIKASTGAGTNNDQMSGSISESIGASAGSPTSGSGASGYDDDGPAAKPKKGTYSYR
jgi:hypothetical protein